MGEAQSRSVMLHHQDQPLNYEGKGGSSSLHHRKGNKDGNYNFLPGDSEDAGSGGGDENRNQMRPRSLAPLGRDPNPAGFHHNTGILSPRSRLPCWSTLEPLPEVECGDDGFGRVPPDGAEETRMEEEVRKVLISYSEEKQKAKSERQQRKSSLGSRGAEEEPDEDEDEDEDEWADSGSESDLSCRSSGSASSLNMENGEGALVGGLDRVGVGEPKTGLRNNAQTPAGKAGPAPKRRSFLARSRMGNLQEEGAERDDDQSSDSDGEMPELMDSVWTLRDREHFKAQEMEKHQAQLTMYRRLALIRWVRTLQSRIQEQQNRLQSSFDVILTQRKELLRMGAAAAVANATPPAAVSQS
eukprot:XP_011607589.1 PREDICTED: UPF0500 protein C1orf216 homolog isoform X2 [Takifugu rubripes]